MTNCPNCGAPISGYICEYCGTTFEDPNLTNLKRETNHLRILLAQQEQTNCILDALGRYILGGSTFPCFKPFR